MGQNIRLSARYPCVVIGHGATVLEPGSDVTLDWSRHPAAASCGRPVEEPNASGTSRGLLYWRGADGRRAVISCRPGAWKAWVADGDLVGTDPDILAGG